MYVPVYKVPLYKLVPIKLLSKKFSHSDQNLVPVTDLN